jgi:ectoine hydroxylase-related dioxygenase (phytanoyl-CoA dioxygenase family)
MRRMVQNENVDSTAMLDVEAGRPIFAPGSSGIIITRLANPSLLDEMRSVVQFYFPHSTAHYAGLDAPAYHALVAQAQDELNRRSLARRLAGDRREVLAAILGSERMMVQSNLYLRATRPLTGAGQENVGWHRESFYGPGMQTAVNFWMPVANVTLENTLLYIPDTHLIPDEAIETVKEDDPTVSRGSAGHRIGLLYSPKRIVAGIDLSGSRPFVVLPGEASIFSGQLIHGAAANKSEKIRFSVDFRLIAAESLRVNKEHFASGRKYFEDL